MKIFLTKTAQDELDEIKIEKPKDYGNIIFDIKNLQKEPFPRPPKGKKIRGKNGAFWCLRSGVYRTIYRQLNKDSLIILRVILRKYLERILKQF